MAIAGGNIRRGGISQKFQLRGYEPSAFYDFTKTSGPRGAVPTSATAALGMEWNDGILRFASHNLLTYSEQFNKATAWTKSNTIVTADAATAPDGSMSADLVRENGSSNVHAFYQSATIGAGRKIFSVRAKLAAGSRYLSLRPYGVGLGVAFAAFDVSDGSLFASGGSQFISANSTALGDGWFLLWMVGDYTSAPTGFFLAFSDDGTEVPSYDGDNTSGFYVWGAQVEYADPDQTAPRTYHITESAPWFAPRFKREYNGSWWEQIGLLVEGAATNLCLQSNGFDTTWTNVNSIDEFAQGTAPSGGNVAWKVTDDSSTGTGEVYLNQALTLSNVAHTMSIFAKSDQVTMLRLTTANFTTNASSYFNLSTGAVGTLGHTSSAIEAVGSGWYRCSIVFTPGADFTGNVRVAVAETDNVATVALDGTSSILIYGAQVEIGTTPTTPIGTFATAVERTGDIPLRTVSGLPGAVIIKGRTPPYIGSTSQIIAQWDDGTDNNRVTIFRRGSSTQGEIAVQIVTGGVSQADFDSGVTVADDRDFALSVRLATNDCALSLDGAAVASDGSVTLPTVTTERYGNNVAGNAPWNGGAIIVDGAFDAQLANDALRKIAA